NKWIELVNNPSSGSTIFTSRKFTVPTSCTLSFRVLTSVANRVYLDQIYADGTQRERFLVKTTNQPPNNTGNPYYSDFIAAGTYQLRIVVTAGGGGKMDVFGRVNYGACANPVAPTFAAVPDILPGDPAPVLPTTSLNGVFGTWSPATVSATTSGLHTFYPASGCCATSTTMYIAVKDWTKAPNSYIFDPADAQHDGIYIPVKKAYAMWKDANSDFGLNSPITGGTVSAVVYWEDVSGIIKTPVANSYNLTIMGIGENAKIKVPIDKTKGKGNAVIAFKVNDEVKWSWHVWVTDDITTNGSVYRQGYETGKNDIPFSGIKNRDNTDFVFQWMNRNLGATNTSFLGTGWNKSTGMMYQWGRKDPIPPLTYKDGTGYSITGDAASATINKSFDVKDREYNQPRPFTYPFNPGNAAFGWVLRPFNDTALGNHSEVPKNIKYSVQHPLTLITYDEWVSGHSLKNKYATWFSDQEYKVNNTSTNPDYPNSVSWDLWSDNRKGLPSNVHTQDTAEAREVRSYEYKSAYDPCPCQWRIPSHYGSRTVNNNSGPWGRANSGGNDDTMNAWSTANGFHFNPAINGGKAFSKFALNVTNDMMPNVKAHVGLGFDFTGQENRNLGMLPITGAYVFLGPNLKADYRNEFVKLDYINYTSVGGLPTASYGPWNGVRVLGLNAEMKANANDNIFMTLINQTNQTNGAAPVRCMKDPNSAYIGNFETEYIDAAAADNTPTLKTWAKDPNSYIVMTNNTTELRIRMRKAYAMQKLYLSANNEVPAGTRSADVYWTTNTSLISNVSISGSSEETSELVVNLQSGQTGNAVVALRVGSTGTAADTVIWSWHIWAPETDPGTSSYTYTTERTVPATGNNIVNPTKNSATPPLTTTFMDRNLGALIAFPDTGTVDMASAKKSMGMQYQWGRKDPLPSFQDQSAIFRGTGASSSSVNTLDYNKEAAIGGYTNKLSVYGNAGNADILNNTTDKQYEKTRRMMNYAVQNPLTYLFNDVNQTDWIAQTAGLESGRWGHATEKSPYDPCPEGWRVPDMLYTSTDFTNGAVKDGVKGSSPWYSGNVADPSKPGRYGINQVVSPNNASLNNAAPGLYMGVLADNAGWRFKDTGYAIGNFPLTGIRGIASVVVANTPGVGIWTAAQTDGMQGSAFALSISGARMETSKDMAPHYAMPCRCAKIRYDSNGKEIGRYEPNAIAIPMNAFSKPLNVIPEQDIKGMVNKNDILVFPNPVSDVLQIQATEDKPYYYQIYNMAGQMVLQGQFKGGQTDVSSLSPGAYLVRINNAESIVKIVKK
ncbi:MAG: T9SS type A sorting domain-containing protein, partial [Sphingobacteriales bacterium]